MKLVLLIFISSLLFSQNPYQNKIRANKLFKDVDQYFSVKNYSAAIHTLKEINNLRKNQLQVLYHLAYAYAMDGKLESAYKIVESFAIQGRVFRTAVLEQEPFNRFSKDEIMKLEQLFNRNKKATKNAKITLQLDEKGLITESIAKDYAGNFYISSIRTGKIIKVRKNGSSIKFSNIDKLGLAVFSLKLSPDGKFLYATVSATKENISYKSSKKRSGLVKIELKTAEIVEKLFLEKSKKEAVLGDFVIKNNGDIYLSDSINNSIYFLKKGSHTFFKLIDTGYFNSIQGLCLNTDGRELFISDYSTGIFRINLRAKKIVEIESSVNIELRGIDGLYFYKNSLIAIQNGFRPNRVLRFLLNEKQNEVTGQEILEVNHPLIDDPTLGAIVDNQFYFVANSQWSSIQKDGRQVPHEKLEKSTILQLSLK